MSNLGDLVDHSLDVLVDVCAFAMIVTSFMCGRGDVKIALVLWYFLLFLMYFFHWNCKVVQKIKFAKFDLTENQVRNPKNVSCSPLWKRTQIRHREQLKGTDLFRNFLPRTGSSAKWIFREENYTA